MISESLAFLKDELNRKLNMGHDPNELPDELVVFVENDQADVINFNLGKVSALLINIEEENTLRPPNQFVRTASNGIQQTIVPELRLNLYILFVSFFKDYYTSLNNLSKIIQYFQKYRIFDQQNAPQLNEKIQKLMIELVTLSFSEQNELWGTLRAAYQPSVLYKVKMVVYEDDEPQTTIPTQQIDIQISK